MALFQTLILAHLIADFPLQTDSIFRLKNESSFGILLHVLVHVGVTAVLVQPCTNGVIMISIIAILHFCCDWLKIRYTNEASIASFFGDQLVHILILFGCSLFFMDVYSVYEPVIVFPALVYVAIPTLSVFLFVLGHDLSRRGVHQPKLIAWSMRNGLDVSHYFSGPLVAMLCFTFLL